MSVQHITDAQFQGEVLNSEVPVLVDFWAEWCGPCKMIAPHLDAVSEEYAGKVKVVKINIDENQDAARNYGVRSIPTLMIFKGGQVAATKIGALQKSARSQFVGEHA